MENAQHFWIVKFMTTDFILMVTVNQYNELADLIGPISLINATLCITNEL